MRLFRAVFAGQRARRRVRCGRRGADHPANRRSHSSQHVPDQARGVEWYQKIFGGKALDEAPDRLMFGDTRLIFLKNDKGQPSTGSALDHIGFSVADLDAKMKSSRRPGSRSSRRCVTCRASSSWRSSRIRGERGSRSCRMPRSSAVCAHLRARCGSDARFEYRKNSAARRLQLKDRLDGLLPIGVWLLVQRGDATPSDGHAIDHIGFRTTNPRCHRRIAQGAEREVRDRAAAAPSGQRHDGELCVCGRAGRRQSGTGAAVENRLIGDRVIGDRPIRSPIPDPIRRRSARSPIRCYQTPGTSRDFTRAA